MLHFFLIVLWCLCGFAGWIRFYRDTVAILHMENAWTQALLIFMLVVTFLAAMMLGPGAFFIFRS